MLFQRFFELLVNLLNQWLSFFICLNNRSLLQQFDCRLHFIEDCLYSPSCQHENCWFGGNIEDKLAMKELSLYCRHNTTWSKAFSIILFATLRFTLIIFNYLKVDLVEVGVISWTKIFQAIWLNLFFFIINFASVTDIVWASFL